MNTVNSTASMSSTCSVQGGVLASNSNSAAAVVMGITGTGVSSQGVSPNTNLNSAAFAQSYTGLVKPKYLKEKILLGKVSIGWMFMLIVVLWKRNVYSGMFNEKSFCYLFNSYRFV